MSATQSTKAARFRKKPVEEGPDIFEATYEPVDA